MIAPNPREILDKRTKNGSILKGLRDTGGVGAGLKAGGICLLVFCLLFAVPLAIGGFIRAGLAIFAVLGAPGILLIIIGIILKNKQFSGYLEYYKKESGLDSSELAQVEQELSASDVLAIGNRMPDQGKKAPFYYCFLTSHYAVFPAVAGSCLIRRISDIVAIAYSQKIPGINGYKWGLVCNTTRDTDGGFYNAFLDKESCMELIGEVERRNPRVITAQTFEYQGKVYDMIKDGKAITELAKKL